MSRLSKAIGASLTEKVRLLCGIHERYQKKDLRKQLTRQSTFVQMLQNNSTTAFDMTTIKLNKERNDAEIVDSLV